MMSRFPACGGRAESEWICPTTSARPPFWNSRNQKKITREVKTDSRKQRTEVRHIGLGIQSVSKNPKEDTERTQRGEAGHFYSPHLLLAAEITFSWTYLLKPLRKRWQYAVKLMNWKDVFLQSWGVHLPDPPTILAKISAAAKPRWQD
jgi:hypothetical protein